MYLTRNPVQQLPSFRLKLPFAKESKGSYQTQQPLPGCPRLPPSLQLRQYQRQAITNWFSNNGRGTLKMATGSGKTITALAIACELYQQINLQVLLVVCPYRHLVTQWARECEKFNLQPILAFENLRTWQSQLSTQLYNLRSGSQQFVTVITTNSTLIGDGFQSQLKYFPAKTLIIGDEAHNLGAPKLEESLPRRVGLRLALSATPERYFDDCGTQSLFDYFGSVLQPEFTLKDAISQSALVHYLYYPILVELTETESIAYLKLTKKIGRSLLYRQREHGETKIFEDHEDLKPLLMQRARLIGAAENKLNALRDLMVTRRETTHTLFYCSDGSQEIGQRSSLRQLKAVAKILGVELGYKVSTYTAHTSLDERENLRRQFESGGLQGLVAIRCLDESPVDLTAIAFILLCSFVLTLELF
ncbi:DEAD/DEAH box helicase family protein [Halotia branconii]|uniref:DEAD/DEAH box helicase family protein n=1 Tax=Halotia branconii CENA392 TaxID=1539056 RepID=A0AAJ6NNG8_9CYAN|nr:DEAD/DEAH box helicase family protein [Halotia branconii]WGV23478.1 DEAD/DEAH box helicase family protein [Halotia branconii CENA392]